MAGFGGTIKLQGEEAYRAALKAIAADLKNVAAEQKLTAATYDKTDTSLSALSKKSEDLKSKLAAQQAKWDTLSKSLKDYQSQQEKNKTVISNVQAQLDKEKSKLEEVAKQYSTNSKEYEEQAKVVDKLEQQLKELNTQYDKNEVTLKQTQAALTSTEADMKKTGDQMKKLGEQAANAGDQTDKLGDSTKDAGEKAQEAAQGGFTVMKGILADLASKVIQKAVDGLKNLATNVYEAGTNFDAAMSKVAAVSGATGKDLDALTEKAKALGESTKFSASEVAEGFNYMAMAGWKTEDMLNGIDGILNLAAASGADLATTSDIVTDALTAMGYSAGEAGKLADVMAAASSNANTNVEMMGETFKYAASVGGSLGYSMEDLALAIGLMANSGVKGERAGTALRSIMQRLATNTGGATDAMKEMGIATTNADGSMRPLSDVMADLRKAMANMTDEQKTATAKTIAGTEAMGGLLAIVNASETDYNKLSNAIANSAGSAEKMAKTMQNNVAGKMTQLKSQLEGIYLTIWNKVEPAISKAISSISKALRDIDWESFGRKAADALGKVVEVFTWLLQHGDIVINAIKGVIAAFVVTKIVNFTSSVVGTVTALTNAVKAAEGFGGAMSALGKVISTNPIGLLVGVIAGLGTAIGGIISSMNDASDATEDYMHHLEEQTEAINENKESWEQLKETQQESLNADMTQLSHVQALKDEMLELVDANGKVKEGYEGRVAFILGALNEALGTEYQMTDGVIQKYGELRDNIDQVIEKKKAEIILNSQQALYEEAITKQADAYARLNEIQSELAPKQEQYAKLQEAYNQLLRDGVPAHHDLMISMRDRMQTLEEETSTLETQYNDQLGLLDEYAYNIGTYEQNMALAHEGRYDEMTTATWEYVKNIQKAGDSEKAQLEKNVEVTNTQTAHLEKLWKETGNQIYKDQLDAAKKQQSANEENLKTYTSTTESSLSKNSKNWLKNAAEVISGLTDKKLEFKDVGEGQVEVYADGVSTGKTISKEKAEEVAKDTVKALDKQAEAKGMGENVITGFTNGTGSVSLWETAKSTASSFAGNILSTLKKKLGIASPSKETKKMGRFLLQGFDIGMDNEETSVLQHAADFGESILAAMNDGLSGALDTSVVSELQNAIPSEINTSGLVSQSSDLARASQISSENMVSAFKQALSEMKIEMDDYEMGKFIDRTVTNAIYN